MVAFFVQLIQIVGNIFTLVIIVDALLSFILPPYHPIRERLNHFLYPIYAPIRRIIPPLGMIDITPIIVIILIQVVVYILISIVTRL